MATEITMPQLSDTMDKGTILRWFKKVGDPISRGDALAEVATDKADLEIESFDEGTLLEIKASEGDTVSVGSLIAVIGQAGEKPASSPAPQKVAPKEAAAPVEVQKAAPVAAPTPSLSNGTQSTPSAAKTQDSEERVKISPLARNIAKSHGVDYSQVSGTGEGGRITKKDVEKLISSGNTVAASAPAASVPSTGVASSAPQARQLPSTEGSKVEPLSKMRQTIASRMVESVNTAPHFFATAKIEVESLLKTREILKTRAEYEGITVTHMIIKAAALALRKFPRINSKFDNNTLVEPIGVNIGIITALPDGLLIPVLKNADVLSLVEVVQDARGLVQRARSGKPKSEDLQGGTFSISNIGRSEVEHFSAIINPGQGAILAVSSIQDEALVKNGQIVPGKTMRVTLSVDHRIIDGVVAGEFLTYLKELLEEPVLIFA